MDGNKIRKALFTNYIMQNTIRSQIQIVNPLIKLVRERQDQYFQLLGFVTAHLASSSNDLDNTSVFNKFIAQALDKHQQLQLQQQQFIDSLADPFASGDQEADDPISKSMLRLFARLVQILEASIERVRRSVFEDSGRAVKEFNRFRISLNKILKKEVFIARDVVILVIKYCQDKYNKQFLKLKKYLNKVREGDDIWFKELYINTKSDIESSPSPQRSFRNEEKTVRKVLKKIDMDKHLSSTQQPQRRPVKGKTAKTNSKKRQLMKKRRSKQEHDEVEQPQPPPPPTRLQTANRLYKFLSMLELNKKEFLEDYKFEQIQQQRKRGELYTRLVERNKAINTLMNGHVRKSQIYRAKLAKKDAKSSGEQRNQSTSSKVSLRTSFVIKRKSTKQFETSTEKKLERDSDKEINDMASTIRNIQPRRRSSQSNHRTQEKSKKLMVVKSPMVFEDELIPQAPITQTQWFHAPLTVKCRDNKKKPDNIRYLKKNHVNPMQNAILAQNF